MATRSSSSASSPTTTTTSGSIDPLLAEANEFHVNEDYKAAGVLYDKFLDSLPRSIPGRLARAQNLIKLEEWARALRDLATAERELGEQQHPRSAEFSATTAFRAGTALFGMSKWQESFDAFELARKRGNTKVGPWILKVNKRLMEIKQLASFTTPSSSSSGSSSDLSSTTTMATSMALDADEEALAAWKGSLERVPKTGGGDFTDLKRLSSSGGAFNKRTVGDPGYDDDDDDDVLTTKSPHKKPVLSSSGGSSSTVVGAPSLSSSLSSSTTAVVPRVGALGTVIGASTLDTGTGLGIGGPTDGKEGKTEATGGGGDKLASKLRTPAWFQDASTVTLTIYAKGLKSSDVKVKFETRRVTVDLTFSDASTWSMYWPLASTIIPEQCKQELGGFTLELRLQKEYKGFTWPTLISTKPETGVSSPPTAPIVIKVPQPLPHPTPLSLAFDDAHIPHDP